MPGPEAILRGRRRERQGVDPARGQQVVDRRQVVRIGTRLEGRPVSPSRFREGPEPADVSED